MKTRFAFLAGLCALLFIFLLPALHAADGAAIAADPSALGDPWALLITAITPGLVLIVKAIVPRIPTWLLPILAALVGLILTLPAHYLAGIEVNWWQGLILGALGVWLRELLDQLKQPAHTVEQNEGLTG